MTLTTSWQTVASWTWVSNSKNIITFHLQAKYITQDDANNRSYIATRIYSDELIDGYGGTGAIFEATYCDDYNSGSEVWYYGDETCLEGGTLVRHNDNGTLTIVFTARVANNYLGFDKTFSGSATVPTIERAASFFVPTSGYVGDEVPITTNVPSTELYNELIYTYKGTNGSNKSITIGTNLTSDSFVWEPPTSIYSNKTDGKYVEGTMKFSTYTNSSKSTLIGAQTHAFKCEFKESVLKPTLSSYSFVETDSDIIAKFGNSANTLFKNLSKPKLTLTPSYKYGATLKSISIKNGSTTLYTNPATFRNITTNSFAVTITDSRGYSYIGTLAAKNFSDYLINTINSYNFIRGGADSNIIYLDMDISYFNGNIVYKKSDNTTQTIANTPTIKYKIGDAGILQTLTSSQYTLSGNKITVDNLNLGEEFSDQSPYKIYLYVNDYLTDDAENYTIPKAVPTFEAGAEDFKINGQLVLADKNGNEIVIIEVEVVEEW